MGSSTTHVVAPLNLEHTHTIILLHGRDSIPSEFAEEFFESQASDDRTLTEIFPTVKWVFPASKTRISARFETEISQWFDIWSVEEPSEKEETQVAGLKESIGEIISIIRSEASLVPPSHIILGGISQGCATAIHALMFGGVKLGGFVGLCSWLPFRNDIEKIAVTSAKKDVLQHIRRLFNGPGNEQKLLPELFDLTDESALQTPVFLSHSQDDEVVPINNGKGLSTTLERLGFRVTWKSYKDGGHWINEPQGVDDIVAFLYNSQL